MLVRGTPESLWLSFPQRAGIGAGKIRVERHHAGEDELHTTDLETNGLFIFILSGKL